MCSSTHTSWAAAFQSSASLARSLGRSLAIVSSLLLFLLCGLLSLYRSLSLISFARSIYHMHID